jgi:hypothetical protein
MTSNTSTLPPDKRGAEVVIISTICVAIAGVFVILRCIARFWVLRICGADDVLTICSLLFSIGFTVLAHAREYATLQYQHVFTEKLSRGGKWPRKAFG